MDEMAFGGVVAITSGLPGLVLGAATLAGKWRSADIAGARDPDRARVAEGVYLVVIGAQLVLMGALFLALPEARGRTVATYGTGMILASAALGLIPLLRARRT